MAKTLVDMEGWSQTTATIGASVSNIQQLSPLTFEKTDLAPFTQFNDLVTQLNTSLASLKTYTNSDVTKMTQAAENKVRDDLNEASRIYPIQPASSPYLTQGDEHE